MSTVLAIHVDDGERSAEVGELLGTKGRELVADLRGMGLELEAAELSGSTAANLLVDPVEDAGGEGASAEDAPAEDAKARKRAADKARRSSSAGDKARRS